MEVVPVYGQPDPERIGTSMIERSNLSLRMGLRRFTRLTNGYSKEWKNLSFATIASLQAAEAQVGPPSVRDPLRAQNVFQLSHSAPTTAPSG